MYWYWLLGWIPTAMAIFGNGLVIYCVCTRRRLHTIPNWFVLSLAVADFCVGAFAFPSQFICKFATSLECNTAVRDDINVLAIFSSVSSLCVMTFDRYFAIVKPLRYSLLMTERRALCLIAVAWMIPSLTYFVPALCYSLGGCYIDVKLSVIIWTSLFEFIPCVVLLLSTVKIIKTARRHCLQTTKLDAQLRYNQPSYKGQRVVSSARVIGTVVAIFLFCYILEVISSLCYFSKLCKGTKELRHVVFFFIVTNSALNPIAYAVFKKDISRELRRLVFKSRPNVTNIV